MIKIYYTASSPLLQVNKLPQLKYIRYNNYGLAKLKNRIAKKKKVTIKR